MIPAAPVTPPHAPPVPCSPVSPERRCYCYHPSVVFAESEFANSECFPATREKCGRGSAKREDERGGVAAEGQGGMRGGGIPEKTSQGGHVTCQETNLSSKGISSWPSILIITSSQSSSPSHLSALSLSDLCCFDCPPGSAAASTVRQALLLLLLQRMAKKKSKRATAPTDAAKGSAAEAANKSAALASTPVEGREADNEGAEEGSLPFLVLEPNPTGTAGNVWQGTAGDGEQGSAGDGEQASAEEGCQADEAHGHTLTLSLWSTPLPPIEESGARPPNEPHTRHPRIIAGGRPFLCSHSLTVCLSQSQQTKKASKKKKKGAVSNLPTSLTLDTLASSLGDALPLSTKKASKKKKKGAVSNLPTSLTLDTLASSLGDALPDALALGKEGEKRLSAKQRGKIVVEETKQMAAVLSHPAFKANPFTAIQQHLSNTLPSAVAPPPLPTKFATRQAQQALEKKKKKKKAKKKASGVQGEDAMEM
ncbi:unnamed protein product [Closterium sp. NIES-64]|nr:unnamed protein product [Closterium sp. NIES-64]